jgi:DNA-binding NtrC family response regulator
MQPTVLVVDDEPALRSVTARALSEDGFLVSTAANASEAWTTVRAATRPFDLIVVDAFMPGEGGIELLHRIRANDARQRFLLITGRLERESAVELPADVPVLLKPFTPDDIVKAALAALQNTNGDSPVSQ